MHRMRCASPKWVGLPSGPVTEANSPPTGVSPISVVDRPTICTNRVMAPLSASAPPIVSGTRSPSSTTRTITNCPGCAFAATSGAYTSMRISPGASSSLSSTLCIKQYPLCSLKDV